MMDRTNGKTSITDGSRLSNSVAFVLVNLNKSSALSQIVRYICGLCSRVRGRKDQNRLRFSSRKVFQLKMVYLLMNGVQLDHGGGTSWMRLDQ